MLPGALQRHVPAFYTLAVNCFLIGRPGFYETAGRPADARPDFWGPVRPSCLWPSYRRWTDGLPQTQRAPGCPCGNICAPAWLCWFLRLNHCGLSALWHQRRLTGFQVSLVFISYLDAARYAAGNLIPGQVDGHAKNSIGELLGDAARQHIVAYMEPLYHLQFCQLAGKSPQSACCPVEKGIPVCPCPPAGGESPRSTG